MRVALAMSMLITTALSTARGQEPNIGIDQRLDANIPLDIAFRDEQGNQVTLGNFFGEGPVVLVLAYYRCPRLCSVSLHNLADSVRKVGYETDRDFTVVAVSIDPRETPALASAKKEAVVGAANRGWHFLTGEDAAIHRLADAVGFRYAYDPQRDLYAHASGIIVVTPDGRIARYFFGLEYSPRDLRFGLEDASAGRIGSPITQPLRMLCFAYDAQSGKYTLMSMRFVQIAAAVFALVLGCFLGRAWRRERRKAA